MSTQKKLEWNVFRYDCNSRKIETFNIFVGTFLKDVEKLLKQKISREEFGAQLKSALMYMYWARCEYEVLIKPWIGSEDVEEKVDIYTQVMLNWQHFCDYVWSFKKQEET